MRNKLLDRRALLLALGVMMAGNAQAQQPEVEQVQVFDDYEVHYNVVNSTFLPSSVAEHYDIEQHRDTAVLTVSVRSPGEEGALVPQPAKVSGKVSDLVHTHNLEFTEFHDPMAIYYVAEVPAVGRTGLEFDVTVTPADSSQSYELQFTEQMFPPTDR